MATTQPPLTAAAIAAMRRDVQVALDGPSGLDDAGRLDAIRALEELACTVSAAQTALTAELADSTDTDHEVLGIPADRRGHGVASMVAFARRESPHRGRRHLGLARVVQRELPHTWSAWRAGRITEWRATVIARETACLSLERRLAVDEVLASDHDAIEAMGERQVVAAAISEAARLDASSLVARRRKAESERCVSIRPAPDTMVWLTALLPVASGVAVHAALTREADTARAQGDPRTKGQVMADELVARVAGAVASGDEVWLRRLYASPATGELVAMDSRARLFPAGLARFIRLRDQVCRTPWCDAPIRHADHVRRHDDGGPTSGRNGQGACEACNYAKEAPRWRARPGPDGSVTTTLPTGHTYSTRPPPIATIRRRTLPALQVDYVLTG